MSVFSSFANRLWSAGTATVCLAAAVGAAYLTVQFSPVLLAGSIAMESDMIGPCLQGIYSLLMQAGKSLVSMVSVEQNYIVSNNYEVRADVIQQSQSDDLVPEAQQDKAAVQALQEDSIFRNMELDDEDEVQADVEDVKVEIPINSTPQAAALDNDEMSVLSDAEPPITPTLVDDQTQPAPPDIDQGHNDLLNAIRIDLDDGDNEIKENNEEVEISVSFDEPAPEVQASVSPVQPAQETKLTGPEIRAQASAIVAAADAAKLAEQNKDLGSKVASATSTQTTPPIAVTDDFFDKLKSLPPRRGSLTSIGENLPPRSKVSVLLAGLDAMLTPAVKPAAPAQAQVAPPPPQAAKPPPTQAAPVQTPPQAVTQPTPTQAAPMTQPAAPVATSVTTPVAPIINLQSPGGPDKPLSVDRTPETFSNKSVIGIVMQATMKNDQVLSTQLHNFKSFEAFEKAPFSQNIPAGTYTKDAFPKEAATVKFKTREAADKFIADMKAQGLSCREIKKPAAIATESKQSTVTPKPAEAASQDQEQTASPRPRN